MNILYLITKDPDPTLVALLNEQKKTHRLKVIDLRQEPKYDELIEQLETFDKVISW